MSPLIDREHLNRYIGGDAALLEEVLSLFEEHVREWLGRLDPMMEDVDWKDAAHALKGAARGVGSWEAGSLCEGAESLIGGVPEKTAKRRVMIKALFDHFDAVISEAASLRAATLGSSA